jgi:Zn-dependent M28 family amino/carboxypeptidase
VARAFATAPAKPRRSVLILANTAEEKGLLGAEYFADQPTVPLERITAAVDLDMPMLLYDFTDVVAYGANHSTLREVFDRAAMGMGVKLSPDPWPEQAIFVRSDHYALAKKGVPAVMLATGMANGGSAAWQKFLANNYHQPSDDLSQPIVWKAGARFAELNYRALRMLADADNRVQWYAHDYFGDLFAPKAPKANNPAATTKTN